MHASPPDFDVAVVGGGPAGTAAAITAARLGASVMLLEAGDFPRQKVCGEFVSAESLNVLRQLLRDVPEAQQAILAAPMIDQTRLWFRDRFIRASVNPPGLSIPRYELDRLLWLAASQAGVCARTNHEVQAVEGDGPFRVISAGTAITATAIIVAAGRWSKFTPERAVPPGPKWLGIKAHFRESQPSSSTDLYFFDGGYCGVQPVGPHTVNACAMVRSDYATDLAEVFVRDHSLAERSQLWEQLSPTTSTSPLIYREPAPVRNNRVFVGDAAAFIDPFVGDGISMALRSGCLAARHLASVTGPPTLADAAAKYELSYASQFAPSLSAAARIRKLLDCPRPIQEAAFQALRLPGVVEYLVRRTRAAS